MHLIWKRPDGFHDASPSDFSVFELEGHSRIWLHNTDKDQYPFRVSGGWEDREATLRINNLVNLLPRPQESWCVYLVQAYNHSMKDSPKDFLQDTKDWLELLSENKKGDTWEVEILDQAINMILIRLNRAEPDFLAAIAGKMTNK